jgi:hypothetical protein
LGTNYKPRIVKTANSKPANNEGRLYLYWPAETKLVSIWARELDIAFFSIVVCFIKNLTHHITINLCVKRFYFQLIFVSDDDAFIPSSVGKKKTTDSNGHSKAAGKASAHSKCEEKAKEKLKPVTPDDFFAKSAPTTKLPKIPKVEKKGNLS